MKKTQILLLSFLLFLSFLISPVEVDAASRQVIYFYEETCLVCKDLKEGPEGNYIQKMKDSGIEVIEYNIQSNDLVSFTNNDGETIEVAPIDIFAAFNKKYDRDESGVPVVFVADKYFEDPNIKSAIDNDTIFDLSDDPFLDVNVSAGQAFGDLSGFVGFLIVLGAGLLDGFNPCAIALLLLFIGLLVGAKDKKVLMMVSITYIGALFLSYFLIGTFFLEVLERFTSQIELIGTIINWFVVILCLVLFSLNMYDFIQARREKYGKIKNQLPKWIQKYNKKIVKAFTRVINNEENKGGIFAVLGLTFLLGITLSITELVCTGQIYFGILYGIHSVGSGYAYVLLLVYNIMFVLPLIVIAVVAVRLKSVVLISNWIRENLSTIKLVTAIFFLGIFIYFLTRLL